MKTIGEGVVERVLNALRRDRATAAMPDGLLLSIVERTITLVAPDVTEEDLPDDALREGEMRCAWCQRPFEAADRAGTELCPACRAELRIDDRQALDE